MNTCTKWKTVPCFAHVKKKAKKVLEICILVWFSRDLDEKIFTTPKSLRNMKQQSAVG